MISFIQLNVIDEEIRIHVQIYVIKVGTGKGTTVFSLSVLSVTDL